MVIKEIISLNFDGVKKLRTLVVSDFFKHMVKFVHAYRGLHQDF